MIRYVKRNNIDELKYNNCIKKSIQSRVYAFSWYLDIVAVNWDVLVLNDYEAVMPIPWRKKFFIKYCYQPLWVLELGVFSTEETSADDFLIELLDDFKYVNLRMNTSNSFSMFEENRSEGQFQYLTLTDNEEVLKTNYKKDRKKDLNRAKKEDLTEKWNDDVDYLIQLFKDNVGKKATGIKEKDYKNLEILIKTCQAKKLGEILSVYDANDKLVASGFFIKDNKRVSILMSSTDFKNRKNGANTFLIDSAIFKFKNSFEEFGFGGSSVATIAKYFKSFGAKTEHYQFLRYNNLPKFLKIFKS